MPEGTKVQKVESAFFVNNENKFIEIVLKPLTALSDLYTVSFISCTCIGVTPQSITGRTFYILTYFYLDKEFNIEKSIFRNLPTICFMYFLFQDSYT